MRDALGADRVVAFHHLTVHVGNLCHISRQRQTVCIVLGFPGIGRQVLNVSISFDHLLCRGVLNLWGKLRVEGGLVKTELGIQSLKVGGCFGVVVP